jgi:hypothetical protein
MTDELDQALAQIEKLALTPAVVGIVVDQSGSMHHLTKETINGFNEFLQEQQKHDVEMVVTIFDSDVNVHPTQHVKDVPPLDDQTYVPQNMTALFDAIGMTVAAMDKHGAGKKVVCIITDGMENASQEYTRPQVREMILDRQNNGWDFVFMGAGLDAIAQAGDIGIPNAHVASYAASAVGTQSVYQTTSNVVTRSVTGQDVSFTDEERTNLQQP